MAEALVTVKALKAFAAEKLATSSPLRTVLLLEADEIPASELCVKLPLWLALLQAEESC